MKKLYADTEDMFYKIKKYQPEKEIPLNKTAYDNHVQLFVKRLNELEREFGLSIDSEWNQDYDGFVESSIALYDNNYGYVGEIADIGEE